MLVENYPFTIIKPGDMARPYLPVTIINPENKKQLNVFAMLVIPALTSVLSPLPLPLLWDIIYNPATRKT
jgi:hypothetical protein